MISRLHRLALSSLVTLTGFCAVELAQVEPAQAGDSAEELVGQLGSDSFQARERAFEQLQSMGIGARQAVEQGLKSGDAEVRARCRRLFDRILKAEEELRLARFVSRGLQPGEKGFDGWSSFQKVVGSDDEARALYAELYRFDPVFMKLAEVSQADALQDLRSRSNKLSSEAYQLQNAQQRIESLRPVAVLTLQQMKVVRDCWDLRALKDIYSLASRVDQFSVIEKTFKSRVLEQFPKLEGPEWDYQKIGMAQWYAAQFGLEKELRDTLRPAFVKSVDRVLRGPWGEAYPEAYQLIRVADSIDLKEVLPLALKTVQIAPSGGRSSTRRRFKARAVYLVGKHGTKEHIEQLRNLLGDRSDIWGFGSRKTDGSRLADGSKSASIKTQLGDVALAAMVHLSGQDLGEYGFLYPLYENPKFLDTAYRDLGFSSEELRQKAITQWKARRSTDP